MPEFLKIQPTGLLQNEFILSGFLGISLRKNLARLGIGETVGVCVLGATCHLVSLLLEKFPCIPVQSSGGEERITKHLKG